MVDVAFYGDDFTGSTDALRQFERGGLRSVLLVELPSASELQTLASRYDVIGVAGIARSLAPNDQEAAIRQRETLPGRQLARPEQLGRSH